jgi:hypothetical protein
MAFAARSVQRWRQASHSRDVQEGRASVAASIALFLSRLSSGRSRSAFSAPWLIGFKVLAIAAGREFAICGAAVARSSGGASLAAKVSQDVSIRANGHIAPVTDADGSQRELVANPVQFDERPAALRRAPQFAEHTDDILRELGLSDEELIKLKIVGAVT